MAHWAVYVALHLPSHASPDCNHLRDSLVQELLMRHAPEWAADAAKRDFLLQKLQLPAAWLDQSLAQWAHYCQDDSGEPAVSEPEGYISATGHKTPAMLCNFASAVCTHAISPG